MPLCYRDNNIKINNLDINTEKPKFKNVKAKINKIMEILNSRKKKFFMQKKLDFKEVHSNLISIEEFDDIFFEITGYSRSDFYFYENEILKSKSNIDNFNKFDEFIRFYYRLLICMLSNFNVLFKKNENINKLDKYIILLKNNNIFKYTEIIDTSINRSKAIIDTKRIQGFYTLDELIGEKLRNTIAPYKKTNISIINTTKSHNNYQKNYKNEIGIIIKDTLIKSISGPVSFYYLRPKDTTESKYFPLIVLFGDYHRSRDFICNNCDCRNGKCCYTISDKSFLSLLDSLVYSHKYPVDFYTETFFIGTSTGFKNGFMENLTTKNMMKCYHKNLKSVNNNKCPAQKIRWQSGDARMSAFSINSNLEKKEYILKTNKKFSNIISEHRYLNKISKKFINNLYIEGQISTLISNIYGIIQIYLYKNNHLNKNQNIFLIIPKNIINEIDIIHLINEFKKNLSKSIFKNIDEFIEFLNLLYNNETKSFTNFDIFLKKFFDIMTEDNSLIYKQILKQDYKLFNNKNYWYNIYLKLMNNPLQNNIIKNNLSKIMNVKIEYNIFESLKNLLNNNGHMNNKEYDNKIAILYQFFTFLFVVFETSILDLYTLLRIFKQPKNGYRSSLSFCYFGNMHILNMIRLLTDTQLIGKYKLVHSIEMKKDNRCLNIDFLLNLNEEVKNHNLQI